MATVIDATLPAQAAAGATIIVELGEIPADPRFGTQAQISRVRVSAPSAVNGVVTNNATINVRRFRAGVLQDTTATITLAAGVNLPADTVVDLPVTGSQFCAPGDVFDAQMVQNGAGLALPQGISVQVEID